MATFTNPQLVADIILRNGEYENDPAALMVISYRSSFSSSSDEELFCVCYLGLDVEAFFSSPLVTSFSLLWTRNLGPTEAGLQFLADALPGVEQQHRQ